MIGNNKPMVRVNANTREKRQNISEAGNRIIQFGIHNEAARTVMTKLINEPNKDKKKDEETTPKVDLVQSISQRAIRKLQDIDNIYEILPDTETAETIMVSSILSPTDLITEELIWSVNGDFPSEIGARFIDLLRETFTKDYKINDHLSPLFRDAIYRKGAYILGIFPESAIDEIINSKTSMESFTTEDFNKKILGSKGFLGNNAPSADRSLSLENWFKNKQAVSETDSVIHSNLTVTDNPSILKFPLLREKLLRSVIRNKVISEEAMSKATQLFDPRPLTETESEQEQDIIDRLYQRQVNRVATSVKVNDNQTTYRKSVGAPLIKQLPYESVMPVAVPGDPDNHQGYFILLDGEGNPVTRDMAMSQWDKLKMGAQGQQVGVSQVSNLLQEMKYYEKGMCSIDDKSTLEEIERIYISLVEKDLIARLRNGVYGESVQISNPQEFYRIMLSRTLAGLQTKLLFMPTSLVQYFAFEYDKFGMGVSLVERGRILAALRASAIYANQVAMIKNAIPTKIATLQISEKETDPWSVAELMLTQLVEMNSMSFMYHSLTPEAIENGLMRSGWEIRVQGHPDIPEHAIELENKSMDAQMVDDSTLEDNAKRYFTYLKVPPALIDDSANPEFATQFVTQNALFNKTRNQYATRGSEMLSEFVRKTVMTDGNLLRELTNILRETVQYLPAEMMEEVKTTSLPVIELFLEQLEVSLPSSSADMDKMTLEAFSSYKSKVEEMIPIYFNRDDIEMMIPAVPDEEENAEVKQKVVDRIEDYIKSCLLRRWIVDNNAFPEVYDIFALSSEEPNVEFLKQYGLENERLVKTIQDTVAVIFARNQTVAQAEGDGGMNDTPDTSTDESTTDDTSTDDTTEFTDDTTEDETTTDEENPEENTDKENSDEEGGDDSEDELNSLLNDLPE